MNLTIWLIVALIDWSIISMSLVFAHQFQNLCVNLIAIIIIGNRLHALHVLGHEGVHRLICKNRFVNDWLTRLFCFYPTWTSLTQFKKFHLDHHRWLGTNRDPELILKGIKEPGDDPDVTLGKAAIWFLKDMCGGGYYSFLKFQKLYPGHLYGPATFWIAILLAAGWLGYVNTVIIIHLSTVAIFLPLFKSLAYTQHWQTKQTLKFVPKWWQKPLLYPHNIWAHFNHHKDPKLPFWKLSSFSL